ncbi:hypothetical protein BT69DRAFT_1234329, partial [Atractiella rhizophila]
GKCFRVRLWVLICDIPAFRKLAGLASHSANLFYSFCYLTKKDIDSWDPSEWKSRTALEHIVAACRWKSAKTHTERNHIFQKSGVRYSCLIELYDYWDPITYRVCYWYHA